MFLYYVLYLVYCYLAILYPGTVFPYSCMSMYFCIWCLVFLCWHFLFLYSCTWDVSSSVRARTRYVRTVVMVSWIRGDGRRVLWGVHPNFLKTPSRLLHAYRSHRLGCLLLTSQFEIMWFVLLKTACVCSVQTRAIRCRHRWRQGHTSHLVCEFVLASSY